MSKISENIVDQIKKEGVKPRPRWQFVISNVLLVAVLIVTILMGGLAMSLIYLKLFNLEWRFVTFGGEHGLPRFFEVLPLLWIILLMILLGVGVWAFEKTESGYKYQPTWVVVGAIFMSMLLGGVVYFVNGADLVEDVLRANIPPYELMEMAKEQKFLNPDEGILVGRFDQIIMPGQLQLIDLLDKDWTVSLAGNLPDRLEVIHLNAGQPIVVFGVRTGDSTFEAKDLKFKQVTGGRQVRDKIIDRIKDARQNRMQKILMPAPPILEVHVESLDPRTVEVRR
ncbi:hypothetical protein IT411_01205 [Candidatus Peregrinibacteria bacterium]|nr:hypothetical protein [Candidatus Peregrinibacteria bacterium]